MLFNRDGTPYRLAGTRQQFNDLSADLSLFDIWDQEAIRIGGSPIYYYEVFIQEQTTDPIYLEDRGKLYSTNPVELWCFYEPVQSTFAQTAFGIDSMADEMKFSFNYRALLDAIGHKPKVGSRLRTPFLKEDWEIIQMNLGEFKMYKALRADILCKRFQDDDISGPSISSQKDIQYKIV
jgi:hypothetical protein